MSYQLEKGETIPSGIKRIALEQIDSALEQLRDPGEDLDEAIHDTRKRFKKVRAVLRLVRDEIGEKVFKKENVCYRDAGRQLSSLRDANVMIETLQTLRDHYQESLAESAFDQLEKELKKEYQKVREAVVKDEEAIVGVITTIEGARSRVEKWPIEHQGFEAVRGGLKRVYRRGRKRMADSRADPVTENFHEWRKRVKYLWYHTRILSPVWKDPMTELADSLHDLSDYLGDDHDLAVLRELVIENPGMVADKTSLQALLGLIEQRRQELQRAAWPVGKRIYMEKPAKFVKRVETYWNAMMMEVEQKELSL